MNRFDNLRLAIDSRGIALLTLARPQKHNALDAGLIGDLDRAAAMLAADQAVRGVIVTGEGESFCAGGDLDWMRTQFAADRSQRLREAGRLANVLRALNELPKPLIGRVNGQAFGGGLGLMCVCDVVVAADSAKFGFTEPRLGLIPATISPYCIARMGEGMARRVFMSGRIFGAAEAVTLGLAASAVPAAELDAAVEAQLKPYLSCAPGAVAASKALARSLGPVIDDAVIEATIARLADAWETDEAVEGVSAFFERRKPPWTG